MLGSRTWGDLTMFLKSSKNANKQYSLRNWHFSSLPILQFKFASWITTLSRPYNGYIITINANVQFTFTNFKWVKPHGQRIMEKVKLKNKIGSHSLKWHKRPQICRKYLMFQTPQTLAWANAKIKTCQLSIKYGKLLALHLRQE